MNFKVLFLIFFISTVSFGQSETIDTENLKLTKDFILGKFDYKNHELFELVNPIYTSKAIYLNKDVYSAFLKMNKQAEAQEKAIII